MATWYAQTDAANINAANMWNSLPAGGGTVLTWPPAVSDVLVANNKIVQVNVNTSVAELRNDATGGATAGGYYNYTVAGVSISATAYASSASYIWRNSVTSGTVYFVGDTYAGSGASTFGGQTSASGTVNVTGNIYGGSSSTSYGYVNGGTGSVLNHVGNAYGGSAAAGIRTSTASTSTITGNAFGGDVAAAVGFDNRLTGTVSISGYAQASTVAAGVNNLAQGVIQVGETRSASNGRPAVTGAFRFASATAAKTMPYTPDGQISMTVLDVAAIVPAESDVRKGLVYGDGAYTGALPLGRSRTSMAGRF
jgi:hypothetical protein